MTTHVRLGLGALLLMLLAAGPGPAQGQPAGELRVALPWTPENLDPTMNLSSIRAKVGVSLFDSLVSRDADNRIVPQLAESWKALGDLTWQFKLRRGVVFHNGEPFNAEAVRFTFERVLDPNQKSPNRANVGEVARVDVVDDYTVNLVLRQPYAPLVNRLIDFSIVPPKYTAEKGNHFKRYLGKQYQDAYLLGLGGPMQDGDELYKLVSSRGRGLYYKSERVHQLFDAGRSTMDPAKRRKIYADLARAIVEDATWVFLMQQVDIYATRERVTWKPRGDQWMPPHEATLR